MHINRIPKHFPCFGIFYHQSFAHSKKNSIFADMKQEIIDKINQQASQNEPFQRHDRLRRTRSNRDFLPDSTD